MILEGDQSVIEILKEKKRRMDRGESHDHIRPLLVIDGGLMKGTYGVGAALTLQKLGFDTVFSAVAGISSGAATVAYFLASEMEKAVEITRAECCSKELINIFRFKNIINTKFFRTVLEGKTGKGLSVEKVLNHDTDVFIGVSEYETGAPKLISPTCKDTLFESIRASIAMPGSVSDHIFVDGVRYVDGASTSPHILEHIFDTVDATHILVLTNQDKDTADVSILEKVLNATFFRNRLSPLLRKAASARRKTRHAFVESALATMSTPACFVWGNGMIGSYEQSPVIVEKTIFESSLWWHDLLAN